MPRQLALFVGLHLLACGCTLLACGCTLLVGGCTTPPPTFDPFLGQTTVPPPGTTQFAPADPYYQPGAPPPVTIPPSSSTPSRFHQGRAPSTTRDRLTSIQPSAVDPSRNDNVRDRSRNILASQTSELRTARPAALETAEPTLAEPPRFDPPADAIDIMALPGPGTNRGAPSAVVTASAAAARDDYGFADDYSSLRGMLEYSEFNRRWKLRYIPVDGVSDKFGGSVLLPDSPDLAGYEPGEMVELRGELVSNGAADGFAPLYRHQSIRRIDAR